MLSHTEPLNACSYIVILLLGTLSSNAQSKEDDKLMEVVATQGAVLLQTKSMRSLEMKNTESQARCVRNCGEVRLGAYEEATRSGLVWSEAVSQFMTEVYALPPPSSDKWNAESALSMGHSYQTMYGIFLTPLRTKAGAKLLEIGLGCKMQYGPGASLKAWQSLLPSAQLWEADYDEACVNRSRDAGQLTDVNTIVGDQGNPMVVKKWLTQTGGSFDAVIDDGGHKNSQIKTSFDLLWPSVNPGGLYFIEDLQVGRNPAYDDTEGTEVMADIIQGWIEQLMMKKRQLVPNAIQHPIPDGVEWIMCQTEACVLGKKRADWPGFHEQS